MTMRWCVETGAAGPVIMISGYITEEADFRPIVGLRHPGTLRLDLAAVEQVNSTGVRGWIQFLRTVAQGGQQVELLRCSPAIVRQLNTLANFRGAAAVRSVLLPYYCVDCGRQDHRVLELPADGPPPSIEEAIPCPDCGRSAEFDDLPKTYMAFAT
jgi:ABC-type transporter Mla MlaB component